MVRQRLPHRVHRERARRNRVRVLGLHMGPVASHAVRGEEQFCCLGMPVTDDGTFSIRKFSQPAALITKVVAPLTRSIQAQFTHDALRRMAQEVSQ